MKLVSVAALCVCLLCSAGCKATRAPLLIPSVPIQAQSMSDQDVANTICKAAITRGWTIVKKEPGHIEANIMVRNRHEANIDIVYSNNKVTINYISSVNLSYGTSKENGTVIHKSYNRWVNNLADDIRRNINYEVQVKSEK